MNELELQKEIEKVENEIEKKFENWNYKKSYDDYFEYVEYVRPPAET